MRLLGLEQLDRPAPGLPVDALVGDGIEPAPGLGSERVEVGDVES